jgi:hypothetical protein
LLFFGQWSGNRLCIFYWYKELDLEKQPIRGLPLTFYGILNFAVFNFLCSMALIAHLRAAFADPGYIPDEIEVPDYVDTALLKNCHKCD